MHQASMLFTGLIMLAGCGWFWMHTQTAPQSESVAAAEPQSQASFLASAPVPSRDPAE